MKEDSSRKDAVYAILGAFSFVTVFSLFVLTRQSLRLDEAQTLWQVGHSPGVILNIVAQDVHVPLYHLSLYLWQLFFGNGVVASRILSLIFFICAIPAVYFLGKLAFNRSVAIFAVLMTAASPFLNWYGNEIRMYSLLLLVSVANQYFFIRIFKKKDDTAWVGFAITALMGIFVHYYFVFLLLAEAMFFLTFKKKLFDKNAFRRFVGTGIVLLLGLGAWLIYVKVLGGAAYTQPLIPKPSTIDLFNTFSEFIFGFQNDHLNTLIISLWPITLLLGFYALQKKQKVPDETLYFIFCSTIPIALAFFISTLIRPLYLSRYLILSIPSVYLLLGWIFSTYPEKISKIVKYSVLILMLITLTIEATSAKSPVREDYAAASAYLNVKTDPQDVVVVSAPFTIYPVEYYYRGPCQIYTLPLWNRYQVGPIPAFSEQELRTDIKTISGDHRRMWILLSYDQGYEDKIKLFLDTHYKRLLVKTFSDDLTLYEYQLRYDIPQP